LDAGCGTGAHLQSLRRAGAWTVGVDLSLGMLGVACRRSTGVAVLQADLNQGLPLREGNFDAVLSTLVSEHLADLSSFFAELFRTLREGGRLVLSAFHPALAAAGIEAKFERDGVEYRLGAEAYSVEEYLAQIDGAGFRHIRWREYCADHSLVEEVPRAARYLGKPMLLIIEAVRPEGGEMRRHPS
jgi:SAM-dependent methyltransferase